MSTFLKPGSAQRLQFKQIAVREQFRFASGSPAGLFVKTGTRTYATPNNEKHTFNGKTLPATTTGRVKYFVPPNTVSNLSVIVARPNPSQVMTEQDKQDW